MVSNEERKAWGYPESPISGVIAKVCYSKGSWAAVRITTNDGATIGASGTIVSPKEGYRIEAEGEYEKDPKYGLQFKVSHSVINEPETEEGIISYLSSGFIKGIGPHLAHAIVRKFKKNTYWVIENDPKKLMEIPGISKTKMEEIARVHAENHVYRDLYNYLNGEVTTHQIEIIYRKYGANAVKCIKENPYRMIYDLDGIGFKKADKLALAAGLKKDSLERVSAAIVYTLKVLSQEGHCFCSVASMDEHLQELVNNEKFVREEDLVPLDRIADALIEEVAAERIIIEEERVYLKYLYMAEKGCARMLASMASSPPAWKVPEWDIQKAIESSERDTGFIFDQSQIDAVKSALSNRVSAITGGPGTGKTTIQQAILTAWNRSNVLLMAPTGKAARRMTEVTGYPAQTIHRALLQSKASPCLIIVDEASMIDLSLAYDLLLTFGQYGNNQIVFIGDVDQLPPIGPGNFFRDLLLSPVIPSVRLKLSYRNSGSIAQNAEKVNTGQSSAMFVEDDSFSFLKRSKEESGETMVQEYLELLKKYTVRDIACIVPMKKRSTTASQTLNKIIRDHVNPATDKNTIPGCDFRVGDRVMRLVNDTERDIYNGDIGLITDWDDLKNALRMETDDGREAWYSPKETDSLTLAYAMTIHKSQGSEYKAVLIAQGTEHYILLQRNLLYTAITRASEKVILIGDKKAVNTSIGTVKAVERNSILRKRISEEMTR